jgi:hypothetical protein
MKTNKIIYWTTTVLIAAFMLFSGSMYLTKDPHMMEAFQKLGYPLYFTTLLGIAKLLGAIGLVQPKWKLIQEWAYAGFAFTFIGAAWSHFSMGESVVAPLIALIILIVSYYFRSWLAKN